MEINPEIRQILRDFKMDIDFSLLCLLGIYHNLDITRICPEEVIKGINVTKIVTIDYTAKPYTVKWNMPLYGEEETDFSWVKDWAKAFEKINPERVVETGACINRMKAFFKRFPKYRRDDVYAARDMYFKTVKDSTYLKHAHKFIKEGDGADTVSLLLAYCKKVEETSSKTNNSYQRGRIL